MEPPPLAGRDMALAAARSTPKEESRLVRSTSSNSERLVLWAAAGQQGGHSTSWVWVGWHDEAARLAGPLFRSVCMRGPGRAGLRAATQNWVAACKISCW
jgi:hypothetical protein